MLRAIAVVPRRLAGNHGNDAFSYVALMLQHENGAAGCPGAVLSSSHAVF